MSWSIVSIARRGLSGRDGDIKWGNSALSRSVFGERPLDRKPWM